MAEKIKKNDDNQPDKTKQKDLKKPRPGRPKRPKRPPITKKSKPAP